MSLPAESPKGLTRCAIYTRKSSTVRLDQPLNSLETQREVCSAYIKSQSHRAWTEVPEKYDDGGYSGGTLRRPALKRLINDVEDGLIDIIVIYKIDRLSRSLLDFIRLMDLLKKHDASFVSVTQTFDTSDSMGRLILNILLTFAQFERELASERIRDRLADRRRRGYFCGGAPPLGYVIRPSGRIVPDPMRADAVRDLFLDLPTMSVTSLTQRLADQGFTLPLRFSKAGNQIGGHACDISRILKLLRNL
jgi:DNA invertase Pin-like site-specific DNA recombinase